jgi:hypothetical protein
VRAESANGLAHLRAHAHGDTLAALLARDPMSEVRRACVRALAAMPADDTIRAALERALADTDRVVRATARVALADRHDPGALLSLIRDPDTCAAALQAISRTAMRDPQMIEAVREILRGDDRDLRVRALEVVTRTRARELLADIAPLLEDARTAPEAVARLVHWGEGALDSAAESVHVTSSARETEGAAMSRLLSHADPAVRDRATRALIHSPRRLPRDAVGPVLERELRRAYAILFVRDTIDDAELTTELSLRFRETRQRILHLVALRESRKLVGIVEAGLRRASREVEAQIAELLDVGLPPELARKVVPLFDRLEPHERIDAGIAAGLLTSQPRDPLGALVALDDPHLRAAAMVSMPEAFAQRFPEIHAAEAHLIPVYERMRFLRSVPLFGDLPGEDLRTIAEIVETVDVRAPTIVFKKGDPGDDLYVILSGRVAIRDGRIELAVLGPREFFGELSLIDHEPRLADAVIAEDAQLLRLRSSDLGELMARRPQIQEQFLIVLARRLRAVTQRVATQ